MQREQEELAERSRVKKSPIELMKDLLIHMQPGEVIAKSMRRIGGKGSFAALSGFITFSLFENNNLGEDSNSKGLPKKRTMQPKSSTVASDGGPKLSSKAEKESQRAEEKRKRERIDRVTELADQLLAAGVTGIYDMTFEAIETSTSNWEYKVSSVECMNIGNVYIVSILSQLCFLLGRVLLVYIHHNSHCYVT